MPARPPLDAPDLREEPFDVYLPVNERVDDTGATHVAHMRGSQNAFVDVLAEFVRTGAELSAPLREPITDERRVVDALESIGPARVESIEPVSAE
jgi:hypothetical protein